MGWLQADEAWMMDAIYVRFHVFRNDHKTTAVPISSISASIKITLVCC
jgi:hypothetical protein